MASYATGKLAAALSESGRDGLGGATVLILGLAYRGNVKEAAFSSALLLAHELAAREASVLVHDPLFSPDEIAAQGLVPSPLPPTVAVDAVILQAAHREYAGLDPASLRGCKVFLDGRGAFDRARVEAAGIRYLAIGDGRS